MSVHRLSAEMIIKIFLHCIEEFPNKEDIEKRFGGSAFEGASLLLLSGSLADTD
jgi:hypothetical protein